MTWFSRYLMRSMACLILMVVCHGAMSVSIAWADKSLDILFDGNSDATVRVQVGDIDETISSDESYQVENDASVTLTAISGDSSTFSYWSGAVTGENSTESFSMGNQARSVTAHFEAAATTDYEITLTLGGTGDGTVMLSGSVHSYTSTESGIFLFDSDEEVSLSVVSDDGSSFSGWGGALSGTSTPQTVTMSTDIDISANFTSNLSGSDSDDSSEESTIPGCGTSTFTDYPSGFVADDFALNNITVTDDGYLRLETGDDAIDQNNIVIPFEQEVAVNFLHEGAGYDESDFGWLLASEGSGGERHEVYANVNDNNSNGVLDDREGEDANGDGTVDAFDNRVVLGTFAAGSELVFYLKVDNDSRTPTYFTKEAWNPDTYDGDCSDGTKIYSLGIARNTSTDTCSKTGWLDNAALVRAKDLFDLQFATDDTQSLDIVNGAQYPHVIVGAPSDKPNEWILGWEDLWEGGDTDHNDMVFIIERRTGGVAQLKADQAIEPVQDGAYYTAVDFEVWDSMPCSGQAEISYYVSIDNGSNWIEITNWDSVQAYTLDDDGNKTLGDDVESWTAGSPQYTYRTRRIDFAGLGLSGRELIWKAVLFSEEETCVPEIVDVNLTGTVATHADISRASPVAQANVLYTGSYETPSISTGLRGHLRAMRTYDPLNTNGTDNVELWDAGEVLTAREPSSRNIYYPDISIVQISGESLADGDGEKETFSGNLAHAPVVGESVVIVAGTETFTDKHTDVLVGSMGGSGTINRFTGTWEIIPKEVLGDGVPVSASYAWYTTSFELKAFSTANVTNTMLGLDNTYVHGAGYRYDFNNDDDYTAADGEWLANWVRGYADGISTKKPWVLDPVDHSVPAVVTPPGKPSWYYGTAITPEERNDYDSFIVEKAERDTIVLVGSRSGMLHAFNAGQFRWGNNAETPQTEQRGYYLWDDSSDVTSWWDSLLAEYPDEDPEVLAPFFTWQTLGEKAPDYGDGEELWAFIPSNLLSRLKNNYLKGEDRAFVDASPAVSDVYIEDTWKTVALCAEGNGGDSVFALDISDTHNPKFMWEFADPDLFRSRSSPAVAVLGRIVADGQTKWVAFFVSGETYDETLFPSIYVIDIANGSVVERIFLNCLATGVGGVPSGQPAIIDSDGNGYVDRLYVGTDKGYMYKVNLPDLPGSVAYPITQCVINQDFDYVKVDDQGTEDEADDISTTYSVSESQRYHSIYASPTVVVDNSLSSSGDLVYNVRIFFGTGDSPYADEDIDTGNTNYHFFAYTDHATKGSTDTNDIELAWFETLPAGQRVFASAYAAAGSVYFGTATSDTEDPCNGSNEGRIYAFSYSGLSLINDSDGEHGLEVGDIITTPLVDDEHLYIKTPDGLKSLGSNQYNNATQMGGLPYTRMRQWREVF